ncbi:MAG: hypothetical protein WAU15_07595 [Nitrosomonas sp.]
MNENLDQNKEIRRILLKDWDPIGIKDIAEAQDEYNSYVPLISQMIISHKSVHEIFEYLWWIETEHMGLIGNKQITKFIAEKLQSLAR